MLLVSPLFIYATLGFMSDMYFLLFLLLSVLFIEEFLTKYDYKNFIFLNLAIIIGFFVRQLSIVSGVALIIVLLVKKKYKWALVQTLSTILLNLLHYYLRIPKGEWCCKIL
jgi:hypothetical protein